MLHLLSRRPSPAMVVASLALFVSLGGGAYAAVSVPPNSVGTAQLKNAAVTGAKLHGNAVSSPKVEDGSLLAQDIKAGQIAAGLGAAGGDLTGSYPDPSIASGAVTNAKLAADAVNTANFNPGAQAPDSAKLDQRAPDDYGAVLSGRINGLSGTAGGTVPDQYGTVSGISTPSNTQTSVTTVSPNQTLVARDLSVQITAAPGSGNDRTFELVVNGTRSGLLCEIANSATSCSDSGPVTVPAGATLSLLSHIENESGVPSANVLFAFRLTAQ